MKPKTEKLKKCPYCLGTGMMRVAFMNGVCGWCLGKGKIKRKLK